jgi:putative Mn2+ efflux pump MntP
MKISRNINYLLMAIGAIIALYAQNQENQNEALMIGGIVLLIIGVYRISKNIPSKNDDYDDDYQNNVES